MRTHSPRVRTIAALLLVLSAACAARNKGTGEMPMITSIAPDRGSAGVAYPIEVTIVGKNFADTGNVISFGPVTLRVGSTDGGTRIVFLAPKERPSNGEVPPEVLQSGIYQIRVTTPSGESNVVSFTLSREPGT